MDSVDDVIEHVCQLLVSCTPADHRVVDDLVTMNIRCLSNRVDFTPKWLSGHVYYDGHFDNTMTDLANIHHLEKTKKLLNSLTL
jgi:hypothetical protein